MMTYLLHLKPRHLFVKQRLLLKRSIYTTNPRRFNTPTPQHTTSVTTKTIEEEALPHYNPKAFFPVQPGKVFSKKYETIVKLGYGGGSTVWLARELKL